MDDDAIVKRTALTDCNSFFVTGRPCPSRELPVMTDGEVIVTAAVSAW